MIGLALALVFTQLATQPSPPPVKCFLDSEAKRANAQLSFENFDQIGTLPSSWRRLAEAECNAEAADAILDYLINGPILTPSQHRVVLFHMGQTLALMGEERRAADFVVASKTTATTQVTKETLNWNDYVIGTWAFLTKDRALLIKSRDVVLASGPRNTKNASLLEALERCFEKPYRIAYNVSCDKSTK